MNLTLAHKDLIDQALLSAGEIAPDTAEQLLSLPKIKVFTDALKAYETPSGQRVFRCTASSTIKDLHGDFMTEDCVRDMARQAKNGPTGNGLTIFLNHSYKVPEDVAGKVMSAQTLTRENDEGGLPIWDMDYEVRLASGTPRLDQTWNLIKNEEITLGISIGAYILEYDFIDKEEGYWGGLVINKVLLVETSIVGIPANQRSWIQNGVIAIGKSLGFEEKTIRRVLDGKEAPPVMTKSIEAVANASVITASAVTDDEDLVVTAQAPTSDNPAPEADEAPEAEVIADAAPETESTDEQPTEATPDETAGETPEEVTDSDDPALADVAPEIALSLEAGSTPAVELVLAALETAAAQVRTLRTEKAELEDRIKVLTDERDQAIKDRDDAAEIIEAVAKAPLGRKTQFQAPVSSFQARFAGIYDQAFLKLLDETE